MNDKSIDPTAETLLRTLGVVLASGIIVLAFTPVVLWAAWFLHLIWEQFVRPVWPTLPAISTIQFAILKMLLSTLMPSRPSVTDPDSKAMWSLAFLAPPIAYLTCWFLSHWL